MKILLNNPNLEEVTYEPVNEKIKIYRDTDCYIIHIVDHELCIKFDPNDEVLAAFMAELSSGKNLQVKINDGRLVALLNSKEGSLSLRKYFYCMQNGVALDVFNAPVYMVQPMAENCADYSSRNIYITQESSALNAHREIVVNEPLELIEYRTAKYGTWYFTYSDLLYEILCKNCVRPVFGSKSKKRPRFVIHPQGTKKFEVSAGQLAYSCYCGAVSSVESFEAELLQFRAHTSEAGMVVDHADNNPLNNTVYNLSLMTDRLNKAKGNVTNLFIDPYSICVSVCSGGYRVCFIGRTKPFFLSGVFSDTGKPWLIKSSEGGFSEEFRWYENPDAFVSFLTELKHSGRAWIDSDLTPMENSREHPELRATAQSTLQSIKAQRKLAAMPEGRFWQEMADMELPV